MKLEVIAASVSIQKVVIEAREKVKKFDLAFIEFEFNGVNVRVYRDSSHDVIEEYLIKLDEKNRINVDDIERANRELYGSYLYIDAEGKLRNRDRE